MINEFLGKFVIVLLPNYYDYILPSLFIAFFVFFPFLQIIFHLSRSLKGKLTKPRRRWTQRTMDWQSENSPRRPHQKMGKKGNRMNHLYRDSYSQNPKVRWICREFLLIPKTRDSIHKFNYVLTKTTQVHTIIISTIILKK